MMATRQGIIFIISAPSGGGKTSIVRALLKQDPLLVSSVSHTTRAKRPGEEEGLHYHFVSEMEFTHLEKNGEFIESATVFGYRYATSRMTIATNLSQGRDVLLDIDWQGATQVQHMFPDASVGIFLLPPSQAILRQRLESRGQDSAEVIQARMGLAKSEMTHYSSYQYLIVNDAFDLALEQTLTVIRSERLKTQRQNAFYADLIAKLLN
jgi:guanylate kinase